MTGVWDSRFLKTGDCFKFTFYKIGTFAYFCTIHTSMTALINVEQGRMWIIEDSLVRIGCGCRLSTSIHFEVLGILFEERP